MNKNRQTANLPNVITFDENGNMKLPESMSLTAAPHSSDDSLKVPSTAWVRTHIIGLSYATQSYVTTQITNLIGAAPAALDTLNELAAALGNDASFSTTVTTSIASKVPQTRTITINGTAYDLSADRSWTIAAGLTSFNTRTGAITLSSADVTGALGFTPYNVTNPSGYITSSGNITGYAMSLNGYANQTIYTILDGPANGPVIKVRYDSGTANRYLDIGTKDGNGVYTEGFKIYNGSTPTWAGNTILHAGNYSSYSPTLTGTGASGTWSISISGNSSTVSGRAVGNSAGNVGYFDTNGNLYVTNPETYVGEVRLGAAWGRGGVYASSTLMMGTNSGNIDFVSANNIIGCIRWDSANGPRHIIGEGVTTTPYTLVDTNKRPIKYLRGAYPALVLDHTDTTNLNHGPTIQFVFNGSDNRQWVMGASGNGSRLDFGMSNAAFGNTNYNPHNGIAGYQGKTVMRMTETGVAVGDLGTYPTIISPTVAMDVRGSIRMSGTFILSGSGAEISNSTGTRMSESYGVVWNFSNSATWHHQIINGSSLVGLSSSGGNYGGGNIYATGDITAYYSDRRLKHQLQPIGNALEKVQSLTGYTYKHNSLGEELLKENPHKVHAGLVAQEVQAVLPEVVTIAPFDLDGYDDQGQALSRSGENYLTIKYERIVPLLIEAIKEQQTQIEELKTLVHALTK